MRVANVVLVSERNETIWSCSPAISPAFTGQSLKIFREDREAPVYAGRRFVDDDGNDVMFENISSYVSACFDAGHAVRGLHVEVWHRRTPADFRAPPAHLAHADYVLAGQHLVPTDVALDTALASSRGAGWNPTQPCRSTYEGDVLVLKAGPQAQGTAFLVAAVGFERVDFQEAAVLAS